MFEFRKKIDFLAKEIDTIGQLFRIEEKIKELDNINNTLNDSNTWQDITKMGTLSKERMYLLDSVERFNNIKNDCQSLNELIDISGDDEAFLQELSSNITDLEQRVHKLKIESVFSSKNDGFGCFLEINSGTGGTDSQDWAEMLLRMYLMWGEKNNFEVNIIEKDTADDAGIKSATLLFRGQFAYGWLKNEIGIHRLVRISPFNANGKRQTSFAGVFCYPEVDDNIEINIEEKDLRVDVFRSSGAGGQHVNKTESAVRITHIPTNIVVQSQTQRSQIQNRERCMKLLKSKLYELETRKKEEEKNIIEGNKSSISWGNQIRNYVLHPYRLVKDLRSNFETGNVDAILNGELHDIIESVLLFKSH